MQETKVVDDNGFNPIWRVSKQFMFVASEVAMLGFRVMDKDTLGSDGQLAQFYCPGMCVLMCVCVGKYTCV